MVDAIILCGGQGKRLRPITDTVPKPLVPINDGTLLDLQVKLLEKYGINKIILACGYKWEVIKERYGDRFIYSTEEKRLGTGGALKQAIDLVDGENFFVLNCDEITDIDLDALKAMGSNTIVASNFNCRFGIVKIENGEVREFKQKPKLENLWASMGVYYLNKSIQNDLPVEGSMERVLFQNSNFKLKAYKHRGIWLTVNTRKDKEVAEKFLKDHPLF
jgi:NDP-sugar pyrophosphorylase family protein